MLALQDPTRVEWPLRLPMTKAGVKAMDAMQLFLKQLDGTVLNQFVVAGASKRGWTTWTVGAVDPRVALIVPIVMDELNFVQVSAGYFLLVIDGSVFFVLTG